MSPKVFLIFLCSLGVLSGKSRADTVTLVNSQQHTGDIQLVDKYTLNVSSASGIVSLAFGALAKRDLDRLSTQFFGMSASQFFAQDPRFWFDRQAAYLAAIASGMGDPQQLAQLYAEIISRRDLISLYKGQ
ncbi:MAG TPA: hypothetical protein VIT23_05620 [Terrimicrobiaceae bacterium]